MADGGGNGSGSGECDGGCEDGQHDGDASARSGRDAAVYSWYKGLNCAIIWTAREAGPCVREQRVEGAKVADSLCVTPPNLENNFPARALLQAHS